MGDIQFVDSSHRDFFYKNLLRCRYQDSYHASLVYCLGICEDTRKNVDRIYDFKTGQVKLRCLREGWQTSGSMRITRLAFNLYTDVTPSVYEFNHQEEQLKESREYSVSDLFCCGFAPYFWEAIKIRYPEYCNEGEKKWEK